MNQRVVITGIGLCTPIGNGVTEFWQNLSAGVSGIGTITLFDASVFPVRIGGEVKGVAVERLRQTFAALTNEKDRKVYLGLEALTRSVTDADVPPEMVSAARIFSGMSLEMFQVAEAASAISADARRWNLATNLQTPLDRLVQIFGNHYRMRNGRVTNCSACAAGAQAIGEAFRQLRTGAISMALAGAADSVLNPLGLGGFSLLRILSTENETPTQACRPFDATRQGTVLAEGAAFLVMETLEHAVNRGARVYAEIIGYGSSLDAYRVTDPEPGGKGALRSMTQAIQNAGLKPEQIDCINAHGTGTLKNDLAETLAIKQMLGRRAYQIPVTANKSMTGHMIAASGAVEAVASVLTIYHRRVPSTLNLRHPDPLCDLDYVGAGSRAFSGRNVLSNSFGFGGQNATLIFAQLEH